MRVSEQVLLSVLRQGGCIRSFWRRSARLAGIPSPVVPDGLVLETPGERGDTPLCYVDFVVVAKGLVCGEEWTRRISDRSHANMQISAGEFPAHPDLSLFDDPTMGLKFLVFLVSDPYLQD